MFRSLRFQEGQTSWNYFSWLDLLQINGLLASGSRRTRYVGKAANRADGSLDGVANR